MRPACCPWCGAGQTIALWALPGGKSSLLNTLSAKSPEEAQLTGSIREDDSKGRHTTTSRSLHRIAGGGWVIDTPGIRTLHASDISSGLDTLFAEIVELAPKCRFRDCTHSHEPGCAVQAAVAAGRLDPVRVGRWRKLLEENRSNTPVQSGPRETSRRRPGPNETVWRTAGHPSAARNVPRQGNSTVGAIIRLARRRLYRRRTRPTIRADRAAACSRMSGLR